jgi:hypothetical protein
MKEELIVWEAIDPRAAVTLSLAHPGAGRTKGLRCDRRAAVARVESACLGWHGQFKRTGADRRDSHPALFISVLMLETAEIVQVRPVSGPRSAHLSAFRMSFRNKQFESEDCIFGDEKRLIGRVVQKSNDQI